MELVYEMIRRDYGDRRLLIDQDFQDKHKISPQAVAVDKWDGERSSKRCLVDSQIDRQSSLSYLSAKVDQRLLKDTPRRVQVGEVEHHSSEVQPSFLKLVRLKL